RQAKRALVAFFGIAEDAYTDVDLACAKRSIPILRVVRAFISKLLGTRRHSRTKSFRKTLQRLLRQAQCFEPGVCDTQPKPRVARIPPAGGGIDMGSQAAQKLATNVRIVHAQEDMRAVIRRRPLAKDRRLNIV